MKPLFFSLVLLVACGGSNDTTTSSGAGSASSPTTKQVSTKPSTSTSTSTSAKATPSSSAPSGGELGYYAKLEKERDAKEKQDEKRCDKVWTEALKRSKANPKKEMSAISAELASSPPAGISKEDATYCNDIMVKSDLDQQYKKLVTDLNRKATTAYERETPKGPMLCPSAKALPADLNNVAKAPYKPKASDFEDAGWKCLDVASDLTKSGLIGQIEYKSTEKSWEVIVRRPGPTPADKVTEYVGTGSITEKGNIAVGMSVVTR